MSHSRDIASITSARDITCSDNGDPDKSIDVTAGRSQAASFLALGDSYTIGQSVLETERWPVVLAKRLRSFGIDLRPLRIVAKTGWTTDELSAGIAHATQRTLWEPSWDLVSLLIGVNNQFRGRSVDDYRAEFVALLETAIQFAGGLPDNVIVISIPDWGVTPAAKRMRADAAVIAAEIDAFNAAAADETATAGAHWIDVTAISRKAASDLSLLARDGLHPSGSMYSEWVDVIFDTAAEITSRSSAVVRADAE
ncbi:lipolytic enzyme [Thecamonas trahens ATCC 50062]|uniref:Lipolytic enzyme n=1 Tax=Thecamonas trahens ATCC 50062 TaxID=461836 RepID=A0A0L0DKW5_THETB|nr:lipolytic enzyme [Thecamonas trahens ATCC 50062]KNC52880.1 lipolytic enzyme [Thecamonas trahens ATCC 50062]|eukprot:XP_013754979.1 lipolytic enzyme [Thecamonas trahens ATCC 50062]